MSTKGKSKRYYQHFKDSYAGEFSFITKSRLGATHAFCTCCRCDISIKHGGKHDILLHAETTKHKECFKTVESNSSIKSAFLKFNDSSVINAECLFTAFVIEHNLPINCSDHAGHLFRKMFPDSKIAKNYACARTKTTAIINEFSLKEESLITESLNIHPFSVATDGSNDVDSKLYPVVVTCYDPRVKMIKSSLVSVPSLIGDATGVNIGNLVVKALESKSVPIQNCVAFGSDNAPVMIGSKAGAATVLKKLNESIEITGCSCHLLNLAAEKGADSLPFQVGELLVDIYYYLQKSSKRKDRLKVLQQLHETEIKKILKHVSTRWLSVGKCLKRVLEQWKPLLSFFKEEAMIKNKITPSPLSTFTIPFVKAKKPKNSDSVAQKDDTKMQKIESTSQKKGRKKSLKRKKVATVCESVKKQKMNNNTNLSREERLFFLMSSELNKAYCLFLIYIVPVFEKTNEILQSAAPHIHILRSLLLDVYKEIILKFVKASSIKDCEDDVLKVKYHTIENQKEESDLLIGHATLQVVKDLDEDNRKEFYKSVKKYFIAICDYMRNKFPYDSELLLHAEVANVSTFENASFESVKYFVERFSILRGGKSLEEILDALQIEFNAFQIFDVSPYVNFENRIDVQWSSIGEIKNAANRLKFPHLTKVMMLILSIPHSNAESERVFSQVRKIRTEYRSSMSNIALEKLLITKSRQTTTCYETVFDSKFLDKAKSCTKEFLIKENNSV